MTPVYYALVIISVLISVTSLKVSIYCFSYHPGATQVLGRFKMPSYLTDSLLISLRPVQIHGAQLGKLLMIYAYL